MARIDDDKEGNLGIHAPTNPSGDSELHSSDQDRIIELEAELQRVKLENTKLAARIERLEAIVADASQIHSMFVPPFRLQRLFIPLLRQTQHTRNQHGLYT